MTGNEYRTVTATFRGFAPSGNAFFVDRPTSEGTVAIARSLIHAADEAQLRNAFDGIKITFRLMAWKAEEIGFP